MSRSIELAGRSIPYSLQITRRQSIAIKISPETGLMVCVPKRASLKDVERALYGQTAWILEKLDELAVRGLPRPPAMIETGCRLPLGEKQFSLRLHDTMARRGSLRQRGSEVLLQVPFELSAQERQDYIKKMLIGWYTRQAGQCLPPLVAAFCARLNLPTPKVKVSRGKSCWGNCSSQGVIHLSWRLMLLPVELCDYVAAHEVCHLCHFNHSPQFWNLLERLLPEALELRQKLKQEYVTCMLD